MPAPQFQRRSEIRETTVSLQSVDLGRASVQVTRSTTIAAGGSDSFTVTAATGETWELFGLRIEANVDTNADAEAAIYDAAGGAMIEEDTTPIGNALASFSTYEDGDFVIDDTEGVQVVTDNVGSADLTGDRNYLLVFRRYH